MSGRPDLDVGLVALEAIRRVRDGFGIPCEKPCVALLLEGEQGLTAARHQVAFTIAAELRRLGLDQADATAVLERWARQVGWEPRKATRTVASAYERKPNGEWRYRPPGLAKNSTTYAAVLQPLCDQVGCPSHCPAFSREYQGDRAQDYVRFRELRWPAWWAKKRRHAAVSVYEAICSRERQLELAPGTWLWVTHQQLADLAAVEKKTVRLRLPDLAAAGLVEYVPGSGAKGERRASRLRRVVPIPSPRSASLSPQQLEEAHVG